MTTDGEPAAYPKKWTIIDAKTGICARAGTEMKRGANRAGLAARASGNAWDHDRAAHAGDPEARIAAIAARQHGVVTRTQLLAAGISPHMVEHRLKRRRLQPLYRAVYRVGPVIGRREREMAAVLACGPGAVVSYETAACVWEAVRPSDTSTRVDVSTPNRCRAPGPDVNVHRVIDMRPDELTRHDGLPITTPARTLLDLGRVADLRTLERAVSTAGRMGLVERDSLVALLTRHPRGRGTRALRTVLGIGQGLPLLTRSEAEARFLDLLRRARVREPETNVVLRGFEVDCLWRRERLIVEIDGFAFHSAPAAFERDRRRDAALTAEGYRVMRVTWRQITREPEAVLIHLALALGRTAVR